MSISAKIWNKEKRTNDCINWVRLRKNTRSNGRNAKDRRDFIEFHWSIAFNLRTSVFDEEQRDSWHSRCGCPVVFTSRFYSKLVPRGGTTRPSHRSEPSCKMNARVFPRFPRFVLRIISHLPVDVLTPKWGKNLRVLSPLYCVKRVGKGVNRSDAR